MIIEKNFRKEVFSFIIFMKKNAAGYKFDLNLRF